MFIVKNYKGGNSFFIIVKMFYIRKKAELETIINCLFYSSIL